MGKGSGGWRVVVVSFCWGGILWVGRKLQFWVKGDRVRWLEGSREGKGRKIHMLNWIGKGFAACEASTGALEADWYPIWCTLASSLGTGLALVSLVRMWSDHLRRPRGSPDLYARPNLVWTERASERERFRGERVLLWLTTTSFDLVCHSNGNHGSACKWSVGTLFLCSFLKGNITWKRTCHVSLSASSGLFMKSATESVVLGRTSSSSEDKSALPRIWVFAHFVYGSPYIRFEMNFWVSEHGLYPQVVSSWSPELIRLRILCSDWIGVSRVSKLGPLFVWPRKIVLWRLGAIGY